MKQGRWFLGAAGVLVFAPAVLFGETTVFYSGAGDGTCGNGGGSLTWAQWRSLSASQAVNYTGTDTSGASSAFEPSVYINGNGKYSGGRAFIPFDTSALPDDAVVTSASVVLTTAAKWRTGAAANNAVKITASTVASPTALTTDDYDRCADVELSDGGIMHDSLAAVGSPNAFALNAAGCAAINTSGWTTLCVRYAYDVSNTNPGFSAQQDQIAFGFRTSEYAGTDSDPRLELTYTVPTPTPTITPTATPTWTPTPTPTITITPTATPTPDVVPPAAPAVNRFLHDEQGRLVEICGTADGETALVKVYDGGTLIGTATPAGGAWCLTLGTPLAAGQHSIRAVALDGAGNPSPDSAQYSIHITVGVNVFKDVAVSRSGSESLRLEQAGSYDFKVAANASAAVTVKAWMRRNASYAGTAPSVTLTGLGIDGTGAATASMAGGADAWEELTVTGTPNADGVLTLRVETYAAAADATAWVDDISIAQ